MKTLIKKSLLSAAVVSTAFVSGVYQSAFADSTNYVSDYTYTTTSSSSISLSSNSIEITEAGSYIISGTLSDGQVVVNVGEDEEVEITLNGVNITSKSSSAFYVQSGKATLILADGTTNYLTDTSNYEDQNSDEEPDAALFAKEDLKIKGSGKLVVDGNYNDAIKTKDDLKLKGGTIVVTSVDDGIVGNDSIEVDDDVTLKITAEQDGLKSNNEDEGTILIEGGDIDISAGDDAIKAYSDITINGGDIDISESYEGIEAETITINDGDIDIFASDDGINISSSTEDQSHSVQTFGSSTVSEYILTVNGGTITIDAEAGDGIDANGSIEQNGGTIRVDMDLLTSGAEQGAIDYDNTYKITDGTLIGFGDNSMAMTAGDISTQNAILIYFDDTVEAGSTIKITDSDGNTILSTTNKKDTLTLAFSSDELESGETYTYYIDGTEKESFTLSSTITKVGTVVSMQGGGQMGGGMMGRGQMSGEMQGQEMQQGGMMRGNMQGGQMGDRPDFTNNQNIQNGMQGGQNFGQNQTNQIQTPNQGNFSQNRTLNDTYKTKIDTVVENFASRVDAYDTDTKLDVLKSILEKAKSYSNTSSNEQTKLIFEYLIEVLSEKIDALS